MARKKKLKESTVDVETLIQKAYEKDLLEYSGDAAHDYGERFGYWCSVENLRDFITFVRNAGKMPSDS